MEVVVDNFRFDLENLGKNLSVEQEEELEKARKDLDLVMCKMVANLYRKEYRKTSNPLYIFKAYQEYRREEFRLPDWILNYFDEVAGSLFEEAASRSEGNPVGERAAFTIKSILGMKRDVFNQYAKRKKQLKIVSSYADKKRSNPESSDEDIYIELEDIYNVPSKTIEGWVRKNIIHHLTPP